MAKYNQMNASQMDAKISAAMLDGREQNGPFKRKRADQELSRGEVKAIKLGRKKLRAELRAKGITSRRDFELLASSMGLYFDKGKGLAFLLWFFHGRSLISLMLATAVFLGVLFMFSAVTEMQGHFTVNISDGMFAEGFVLSDTEDFEEPATRLFCDPATDVPCISIMDIKSDVNDIDGDHPDCDYFAYTFYIRNEGESSVDYDWYLALNSESQDVSVATWVMVFEDDEMSFYAKLREDGTEEAIPYYDEDRRGYLQAPFIDMALYPDDQYEVVAVKNNQTYYRIIPLEFESDERITSGHQSGVDPQDVHKYTIVLWLEGDDPDCTDALIGGHLGVEMQFKLIEEEIEEKQSTWLDIKWKELDFWEEE